MSKDRDFGFGVSTCTRCGSEMYESETLSRCLKCLKSTPWEVPVKEYYKNKNNDCEENEKVKFGLKTIVNYFLYNKKTGEKLVEVDISNDETPIIELGDQFNINVDVDANTFLKAVAFSGEIERLHKIQSRTKKQRTKNKLQKRIDTYEK